MDDLVLAVVLATFLVGAGGLALIFGWTLYLRYVQRREARGVTKNRKAAGE